MTREAVRAIAVAALVVLAGWAGPGAQQMPDPSLIHGRAIPAPELPNGTVTVRVVRESIGNNITGQAVTVTAAGTSRTATTDEQGRAEFRDLPQGAEARAEANVGGEPLVSEPFQVPASGGLRVILVAGLAEAAARRQAQDEAAAAAPPARGVVVLGENTRVLMQFDNDTLQVFYVLDIVNSARTRVDIGGPLIIDLPAAAGGTSVLEGSSPAATASGNRVVVSGPFAPGSTLVQVGFSLRHGRSLTIDQQWPVALQRVTVGVEKVGDLQLSSPQFTNTSDLRSDNGTLFLVGNGGELPAGGTLTIQLANLPAHSLVPRYVALAIALAIAGVGVWLSMSGPRKGVEARETLVKRRDALLQNLAQLEVQRNAGRIPADRYTARRQRFLTELEQVYGELDEAGAGPRGGGEGVAA